MTSFGGGEPDTPPDPHDSEAVIDDYYDNEENMTIVSRRERVIHGRGRARTQHTNATPARRENRYLNNNVELAAPNWEEKEKDYSGTSNQNAPKPSIEGKWGHDMYDKICQKTSKHTLADHWANSYGFRNQRDGNRQRLGLQQKSSEVLSSDWRQAVKNPRRNQEGGVRRGWKPGICFDYLKGQCWRGSRCKFSHDDNRGSGICYYWQQGLCKRGAKCIYSHGNDKGVYGVRNGGRSNICFDFLKGVCFRESCRFSHEDDGNGACSQKEECNDLWNTTSEQRSPRRYSMEEYNLEGISEGEGVAPRAARTAKKTMETSNPGECKNRDESWENTSWESVTSSSKKESPAEADGKMCDRGYESKRYDSQDENSWEASTSSLLRRDGGLSENSSEGTECTIPLSDQGTSSKDDPDEPQPEQSNELLLGNVQGNIENPQLWSMNEAKVPTFNLILVGETCTGKTTFIKRHTTGEFEKKYNPTLKSQVHRLTFYTNLGKIVFNCWDNPGQMQLDMCDRQKVKGNAGVVMFDVTSTHSYSRVPKFYEDLTQVCGNIPIALCGNKVDADDRKVMQKDILFHKNKPNVEYYDISAKTNYNFEKPLLWIARQLCGNMGLAFKEEPLPPSGFHISKERMLDVQKKLADASKISLPDDDDFDES